MQIARLPLLLHCIAKKYSKKYVFMLALIMSAIMVHGQQPWLHVDGNQIKDPAGNIVTLRGVSVLAPEHNNECSTCGRKPISEMITWQADASQGWNSRVVRLQVTTAKVSDPATSFATNIDPYVQQAVAKGLYVIVDLHFVSDYGPGGIPQSYVLNFWNYVAPKYANNPNVIFEVFNEPINPDNWTTWKNYIQPVVNAIRAVAPNNLILVGGPQWSTRVNGAVTDPIAGNNIVYVYHIYPNQGAASNTNLDTKFGNAAQSIPVMITEFGWNQHASYSNTVTRGTTSLWGQPFRTYLDARPHISWTGYIFDNYWMPQYFDANWTLMSGENQGQFMQDWFNQVKGQNQPQPANLTAAAVSPGQINLSWPSTAGALSYNLKRATTSGGPYTTIASGLTSTVYSNTGLSAQTTYYYVYSAVDALGEGANSPQASATTEIIGHAPDVPMLLTATGGNGQVSLSWGASTGATGYNVKRSTTHGGPYTTIATGVTTPGYTDMDVTNGTNYFYVVSATGGRESANSAQVSEIPSSVVIIVDNSNAVTTGTWTTSSASPGFYGSNYLHDGNTGVAGGKSARFSPSILSAGSYHVSVRWASNANRASNTPIDINHSGGSTTVNISQQGNGGIWVPLGIFNFDAGTTGNVLIRNDGANGYVIADAVKFALAMGDVPAAPAAPSALTATSISTDQINLGWTDNSGNENGFEIERATDSTFSAGMTTTPVASNSTTYQSTGLSAGTTYYYRIRAVNSVGASNYSNTANATTQTTGTTTMHVQSITTSTINAGQGKKRGQAVVSIHNNQGLPVSSATVSGSFTGTFNESVSGITGTNGTVTLQTVATAKGTVSVNFCVSNVSHSTISYDATQNVITCTENPSRMRDEGGAYTGFGIYPNPASSTLLIEGLTEDVKSVSIYDMLGRKHITIRTKKQSSMTIDIQKLEPGVYILRADGNKMMHSSFVKSK